MAVYEVPTERWPGFCEGFTDRYRGENVSVEVVKRPEGYAAEDGDGDRSVVVEHVPLEEVRLFRAPDRSELQILVGGETFERSRHVVTNPSRIRLDQHDAGPGGMLRIDSTGGLETVLRLDQPFIVGEMDGLAE